MSITDIFLTDIHGETKPEHFLFLTNSPEEIIDIIKKLDLHKSTGPFSIPNKILHLCINEISTILSDIFNLSLTTGRFLTKLKTAKVIPQYKSKGSEQGISNFRVLLYNLDKIFRETSTQKVYTIFRQKQDNL